MAGPDARRTPRRDARRPAQRPAARPPVSRSPGRQQTPTAAERRKTRLTSRSAVVFLVMAVLLISYASSMRAYLNQRAHIADTRARIAAAKANIATLQREKTRWTDAAFVEAQARGRLGWVLPGEVAYQVIGRDGKPVGSSDSLGDPGAVVPLIHTPVWTTLYDSMRAADHPPKVSEPATKITPKKP